MHLNSWPTAGAAVLEGSGTFRIWSLLEEAGRWGCTWRFCNAVPTACWLCASSLRVQSAASCSCLFPCLSHRDPWQLPKLSAKQACHKIPWQCILFQQQHKETICLATLMPHSWLAGLVRSPSPRHRTSARHIRALSIERCPASHMTQEFPLPALQQQQQQFSSTLVTEVNKPYQVCSICTCCSTDVGEAMMTRWSGPSVVLR